MRLMYDVDVVVCGGGAAGLFVAKILCEYGLTVLLIEREVWIASAASIKNEGFLHSGAFHSAVISDREEAIAVALRSRYGHEAIRFYAPESIEDVDSRTYALIPDGWVKEVLSRWKEADVRYRRVSRVPDMDGLNRSLLKTRRLFEVCDLSIDTRKLYRKLVADISRQARILRGFQIVDFVDGNTAVLESTQDPNAERLLVRSRLFVHAIGAQIGDFFRERLGCEIPVNYYVSHLLDVIPRACKHGFFMVEEGMATLMHHTEGSIAGLAREQTPIPHPSAAAEIPEKVELLRRSAEALIPGILRKKHRVRACVKVSRRRPNRHASLIASFGEVGNNLWLLPGKMTEAPFIADEVFRRIIWPKLELGNPVHLRPLDFLLQGQGLDASHDCPVGMR